MLTKRNKKNKKNKKEQNDFALFCKICDLLQKKSHFEISGVKQIIDLAYSMNQAGVNRRKDKTQLLEQIETHQTKPKNLK